MSAQVDVWVQQYQEMNASTVASWRAANKTYWFYWCIGPSGSQFMNTFVERPAIQARLLFWYGSLNEVPGFLYYETDRWAGSELARSRPRIVTPSHNSLCLQSLPTKQ